MTTTIKIREVEGRSLSLLDLPSRTLRGERTVTDHPYYQRAALRGDVLIFTNDGRSPFLAAAVTDEEA